MTEQWLARSDEARPDTPAIDRRIRAALVTAMKVGIPLLHEHVSRALGVDMFAPKGSGSSPSRCSTSTPTRYRRWIATSAGTSFEDSTAERGSETRR